MRARYTMGFDFRLFLGTLFVGWFSTPPNHHHHISSGNMRPHSLWVNDSRVAAMTNSHDDTLLLDRSCMSGTAIVRLTSSLWPVSCGLLLAVLCPRSYYIGGLEMLAIVRSFPGFLLIRLCLDSNQAIWILSSLWEAADHHAEPRT